MSFSYVGDNPIVGFGYFYQFLDVSGVAGSHFYNSEVMFCLQAEEGEWHAYRIIQISLRVQYVIFPGQYGGYKLFGSCLAVGSCNANDTRTQPAAVIIGQLLQGAQAIIH